MLQRPWSWWDSNSSLPQVAGSLADKAILLKLAAGSQEAGYLAALFPLPKTPTLVIMTYAPRSVLVGEPNVNTQPGVTGSLRTTLLPVRPRRIS